MSEGPLIEVEATFLPYEEGGRIEVPLLKGARYMPHLVVQSLDVRKAIVVNRTFGVGEEYLPVAFLEGPPSYRAGESGRFTVELMDYLGGRFEAIRVGAPFTIREGPKIIGFGTVTRRPSTDRSEP